MHNRGAEGDEEWASLVRVLRENADDLVAHFMTEVRQLPSFSAGRVPPERLEADAGSSFDYLLRRIGGSPPRARLDQIGPSIGRDMARWGVPLNELLSAVRLDFHVLWHALRESARRDQATVLVDRAEHIWEVVEEYSSTIQVSYLEESAVMSRERARERNSLVTGLLSRPAPQPQDVARVALALDVDPDEPFVVAAVPSGADKQLRAVSDALSSGHRRAHLHEDSTHTTMIVRWHSELGTPSSSLLRNTVVNRLKRLAYLTGLDITKPNDAALLMVAASWRRVETT